VLRVPAEATNLHILPNRTEIANCAILSNTAIDITKASDTNVIQDDSISNP
jgi:hypothetical protein